MINSFGWTLRGKIAQLLLFPNSYSSGLELRGTRSASNSAALKSPVRPLKTHLYGMLVRLTLVKELSGEEMTTSQIQEVLDCPVRNILVFDLCLRKFPMQASFQAHGHQSLERGGIKFKGSLKNVVGFK